MSRHFTYVLYRCDLCSQADLESRALQLREEKHNINNYTPDGKVSELWLGQTYLEHVDNKWRRTYRIA